MSCLQCAAFLAIGTSWCFAAPFSSPHDAILRVQDSLAKGDTTEAQNQLQTALHRWSKDAGLINLQGVLLAMNGNMESAEASFQRSVKFNPRLAAAWKNLAKVYMGRSDMASAEKAERALNRALRNESKDIETRLDLAQVLEWRGAFASSLHQLEQLPSGVSDRPLASALRCANFAGLGRTEQASAEGAKLAANPAFTEHDALAALPVLERQLPAVALVLEEALRARQMDTELSRAHLGAIYEGLRELEKAQQAFEISAQARPQEAGPLLDLARVAYKQKNIDGALGYVAHARELAPENAAAHFFFGILAVEKNLPLEARKSLATAVRLAPENASYNYAMGAVSLQGPDAAEAIPYFQNYLKKSNGDPRGRFALGVAFFSCGDFPSARKELEAVKSIPETAAGAHFYLGKIDSKDSNAPEAEKHLLSSIQANSLFPEAHAELAILRIHASEYDLAASSLHRALELDPSNASANRYLLILYRRLHDSRAEAQAARVAELEKKREEKVSLLFRTIEIQPYP